MNNRTQKSRNGRFARHAGNGFPVSDDGRLLSVFKREIKEARKQYRQIEEENKMKVSSLMFIQQLLETEVEKEKKAVEKVKTLLAEKEDAAGVQWNTPDNKVDDNIRFLRSAKATHRENLSKVEAVLEDFMGKDWN